MAGIAMSAEELTKFNTGQRENILGAVTNRVAAVVLEIGIWEDANCVRTCWN